MTGFPLGAFVALKGFVLAIPSGTWQPTGNLSAARPGASPALLQNGSVLITGGDPGSGPVASADLFNSDGSVSPLAAPINNPRSNHVSATLQDGRVLVAGGTVSGGGATNSAEIFDPVSGTWTKRVLADAVTPCYIGHEGLPSKGCCSPRTALLLPPGLSRANTAKK